MYVAQGLRVYLSRLIVSGPYIFKKKTLNLLDHGRPSLELILSFSHVSFVELRSGALKMTDMKMQDMFLVSE